MTGLITRGDATLVFNGVDTMKESLLDLIKLMSSNHYDSLQLVDWSVFPHPWLSRQNDGQRALPIRMPLGCEGEYLGCLTDSPWLCPSQ